MTVVSFIDKEEHATRKERLSRELSKLEGLKKSAMELQSQYASMLPKVSTRLIEDLLRVQNENPNKIPIFTLEVFTRKAEESGIDADTIREHIWNTTRQMPAIYDNGTHYVTNQKLTLETLKRLNDFEHVLKVTGEYFGRGYTSTNYEHECATELEEIRREVNDKDKDKDKAKVESPLKSSEKTFVLNIVLFTIIGIAGAVALGGYVISGGILPNAHTNDDVAVISSIGLEPGMLYGYVGGPIAGLPAVGASIIAEDIETSSHASNSLISVDGKYYLNLVPGKYDIIAAFPDGTTQTYHDVAIKRGTASEMNITYE